MSTPTLGEARHPSPLKRTLTEDIRIPEHIEVGADPGYLFELAGPRAALYFDPAQTRAGIVTCGGLCPGLNNVIRSIFLELHHGYGVKEVLGFRNGYQGLDPARGAEPVVLSTEFVDDIHQEGGTVLGTSRGPVDTTTAVDNLIQRGVNLLFTIGGDGTQRGGNDIYQEARSRGYPLAVVGIPKTVDNDVAFVSRTFGYFTAVEEAAKVLKCAHTEAHSVHNGIAVVKLMGRHAGFIAGGATVASQDVNFCLIPEVPFTLAGERGLLAAVERRILQRAHAVIVVAEGAGQDLLVPDGETRDASGNVKFKDIGLFLCGQIEAHFKAANIPATLRYFDPNYIIRSVPADAEDS
ncbi:MAG: ATP-dependent 6-phosphofructokinase, partial [Verrucomicrobiota bacterium]